MICILITTMFAACSSSNTDEIKIGINYELSGENATYGQGSVEGIELAIEEINAAGGINGKKIIPVKYDNQSTPSEATILANKLVSQDKVLAILGPATTGCFTSEIPVANKNKVPIATGSATGDNVTFAADGSVHEYVFRICFFDSFQGQVMANFAAENLSAKNAELINCLDLISKSYDEIEDFEKVESNLDVQWARIEPLVKVLSQEQIKINNSWHILIFNT